MIARKAALAELLEHPEIEAGCAAQTNRQPTDRLPGYGRPEFQAKRKFNIYGKTVEGYDAAVEYLVKGAKAFSTKGPVKNEGIATIVLGPPAAGKSTFSERLALERYSAIVDSDEAKKILPEYDGGAGVNTVHAESGALAQLVAKQLARSNANLVFPTVGADPNAIRQLAAALKGLGYRIDLVHVNVAPDEAFRRMIGRYRKRLIALEYFKEVGDRPRQTYYIAKGEGLAHETVEIDANGAPGQHVITEGAGTEPASYLRP
jgi:AAA domain